MRQTGPNRSWAGRRDELRGLLTATFLFVLASSPALALDAETLAGYSTDFGSSSFAYAGFGLQQPIGKQVALRGRLFLSYLTFEFGRPGGRVKAEAPAVTPLLGLRYQLTPDMSLSAFGGGQVKETRFRGAERRTRDDTGGVAQLEFYYQLSPKADVLLLYNYSAAENSHWGRAAIKREFLAFGPRDAFGLGLGAEGIGQGNADFTAGSGALLMEVRHHPTNGSLLLAIGVKHFIAQERDDIRPYVSLNIYLPF